MAISTAKRKANQGAAVAMPAHGVKPQGQTALLAATLALRLLQVTKRGTGFNRQGLAWNTCPPPSLPAGSTIFRRRLGQEQAGIPPGIALSATRQRGKSPDRCRRRDACGLVVDSLSAG